MILNRTRELMAAARIAVARALAHGLIRRAKFCSECGRPSHKIEGHHKDYAQPLVLEWLCRRCEGATNQIADEATIEYLLRRDASSRERMIEAHNAQAIASRAVCDLMHGERGR